MRAGGGGGGPGSVVGAVNRSQDGRPTNHISIPSWPPGIKRPGRESNQSLLSTVEIKNG
jgi:hypothetical protein